MAEFDPIEIDSRPVPEIAPPEVRAEFEVEAAVWEGDFRSQLEKWFRNRGEKLSEHSDDDDEFDEYYDPDQPRDGKTGQWTSGGSTRAFDKAYDDAFTSLNVVEIKAIESYSDTTGLGGYSFINQRARTGEIPFGGSKRQKTELAKETDTKISALESALSKGSCPNDITVYRGVHDSVLAKMADGAVVHDKGFVSTSLKPSVAERFTRVGVSKTSSSNGAVVEVRIPKGAPGLPIGRISRKSSEAEFLLQRDAKFKVSKSGGKTILSLLSTSGWSA